VAEVPVVTLQLVKAVERIRNHLMHHPCYSEYASVAVRSRDRSRYGYKRLFPVAYRDSRRITRNFCVRNLNICMFEYA